MVDLVEFNALSSRSFRENPYPLLAELRETRGVVRLNPGLIESHHVFRYEDIRAILTASDRFSSDRSLLGGGELGDANLAFLFNNMISATGDKHRRLRMIGNRVFMPKFIERFRPSVEAVVHERMEMALSGVEFDLVEDFAAEITVAMITAILGLPRADMDDIRRWTAVLGENSGAATWLAGMDSAVLERGQRTALEMTAYFQEYMAERRARPREGDLISDFMAVEVEGERLSDDEILSMAMLMLLAGNETTTNLIVNFLRLCDAFPEAAAHLRTEPDLTVPAVEETLRMRNSIRNIDRYAVADETVAGVTIPAGGLIVLWLSAGNRDPTAFESPDDFRPDRYLPERAANRHLAFGAGPHFCLGAPLARMETQIAVRAVLERTRAVVLTGAPSYGGNASFDNVTRQMARFVPR